jgi:opacity protein-like surface antigen
MSAAMARRVVLSCAALAMLASPGQAFAQAKPRPATARPSRSVEIGGYAMFGRINFTAADSFDAIFGESSGPIFGGGVRISEGGAFLDVGAWQYSADGERAFVAGNAVFPLGIPIEVTVTPIEISGGWRFRIRKMPKLTPYAAGGWTLMRYQETSEFSSEDEDVEETFNGFHLFGGVEYKITRWFGVAGEASWTTVANALGDAGVSEAFNETDLGGTTLRFKITIGR